MTLSAFIVDDEPLAREGLALRLADIDGVEVTGSFARADAALEALRNDAPDVVFLDVQMPGRDGFEMLADLAPEKRPVVVFVTAYDEYAVRAFEVRALDYLLKPVDAERLAETVAQVRERVQQQTLGDARAQLQGVLERLTDAADGSTDGSPGQLAEADTPTSPRIAVRTHGRVVMLRPHEIDWVEGAGDYVQLHTSDGTHLLRETMQAIEERLGPHGFQRIHRSTIVNLDRVRALTTDAHGAYLVCLDDGPRLKLSRSYREAFEDAIGTSF
jgi:two-component system LytT family response regulator